MNTSTLTQPTPDPRRTDIDQLNIISIFHFVGAGLAVLGMLFLFMHYMILNSFILAPHTWSSQAPHPPSQIFDIFIWFYLVFGSFLFASATLNILSGLFIRSRKHRTFSVVVAAINCVHIPLGTFLGIFTIVILMRESIRELYNTEQGS